VSPSWQLTFSSTPRTTDGTGLPFSRGAPLPFTCLFMLFTISSPRLACPAFCKPCTTLAIWDASALGFSFCVVTLLLFSFSLFSLSLFFLFRFDLSLFLLAFLFSFSLLLCHCPLFSFLRHDWLHGIQSVRSPHLPEHQK